MVTGYETKFLSVPAHQNIPRNELADQLAKLSTAEPSAQTLHDVLHKHVKIRLNLSDILPVISEHCFKMWENHYRTDTKGNAYKAIFPTLSKPSLVNKTQHSTIFRLSAGHCQLNHHLFRIGLHSDGLCDNCAVPETVDHFLRTCSKYGEARQRFKQAIDDLGINFDTTQILQNAYTAKSVKAFVREARKHI